MIEQVKETIARIDNELMTLQTQWANMSDIERDVMEQVFDHASFEYNIEDIAVNFSRANDWSNVATNINGIQVFTDDYKTLKLVINDRDIEVKTIKELKRLHTKGLLPEETVLEIINWYIKEVK